MFRKSINRTVSFEQQAIDTINFSVRCVRSLVFSSDAQITGEMFERKVYFVALIIINRDARCPFPALRDTIMPLDR